LRPIHKAIRPGDVPAREVSSRLLVAPDDY
jgi:hypothetical protein